MKLHIYITDPEEYLNGNLSFSLRITPDLMTEDRHRYLANYLHAGTVEVELDADDTQIRQIAVAKLDEEIKQKRASAEMAIQQLEDRKQNLLALEYQA